MLLILDIDSKELSYHSTNESEHISQSELSDSLHVAERTEMEFALAGEPMQMARQENVRSANNYRTVSQRNHHNYTQNHPNHNYRNKSSHNNNSITNSVQSSDYGRVSLPVSLRIAAVDRHVFLLHHILI